MKRTVIFILFMMVITLPVVPVIAAELLDVKPVVAESGLTVEILADIPLTYTYYKVPGQARAVVDIADADPEKVEPLIVVNKGAVSSISVDKAQISGMVVSRLIFNLVSEADISVTASADRKKLTVAFSGGKPASKGSEKPAASPAESAPAPLASPAPVPASPAAQNEADPLGLDEPAAAQAKNESAAPLATAKSAPAKAQDETDPLGLDERLATPEKSAPAAMVSDTSAAPAVLPQIVPVPTVSAKLVPVVPVIVPHREHMAITAIKVETTYIDIEASGRLDDFKQMKLTEPNRLVIDVPGATSSLSAKAIPVRRFGLAQVRVGRYPDHTRIVLDSGNLPFPDYEIKSTGTGLRINFKQL